MILSHLKSSKTSSILLKTIYLRNKSIIYCKHLVQRLRATLHQLHQWEVATILQPSHVCPWARRIQERGHQLGIYWFWNGLARLYWAHWKGRRSPLLTLLKTTWFWLFSTLLNPQILSGWPCLKNQFLTRFLHIFKLTLHHFGIQNSKKPFTHILSMKTVISKDNLLMIPYNWNDNFNKHFSS